MTQVGLQKQQKGETSAPQRPPQPPVHDPCPHCVPAHTNATQACCTLEKGEWHSAAQCSTAQRTSGEAWWLLIVTVWFCFWCRFSAAVVTCGSWSVYGSLAALRTMKQNHTVLAGCEAATVSMCVGVCGPILCVFLGCVFFAHPHEFTFMSHMTSLTNVLKLCWVCVCFFKE